MKTIINTPVSIEAIRNLRVGDVFYLSGYLATGRDDVHRRIVREGLSSPYDFKNMALMHAGPIIKKTDKNELISIGPTSSVRMEADEKEFIARTGVRIIIGKGGMGQGTSEACKEYGAIHCVFPGGCAVIATQMVEELKEVYWEELGMPEAIWVMRVKEFGPLIVSIDTEGNNMFLENRKFFAEQKEKCMKPIKELVKGNMTA